MIEPTWNDLSDGGARVTESLVEVDKDSNIKVMIENHSNCPEFLEEGTKLGILEPVQVLNRAEVLIVLHLETDWLNEKPMETAAGPGTESVESQKLLIQLEDHF